MKNINGKDFNYYFDFGEVQDIPRVKKPETENDRLINCQYEWLVNHNQNAFGTLWSCFTVLCKKAIKKEMREKHIFFDFDEIAYKADIACEYVMRRYTSYKAEGKTYIIENFATTAYYAVKHALYSTVENDKMLDLCKTLNGKPLREVQDKLNDYIYNFELER